MKTRQIVGNDEKKCNICKRVDCDCEYLIKNSGIPKAMINYRFDTFPKVNGTEDQKAREVKEFLDNDSQSLLLLVGNIGTGKTSLAVSSIFYLLEKNKIFNALRIYAYDVVLNRLSENSMGYLKSLVNKDFLIIEEVGLSLKTNNALEYIERIILGRYDELRKTIIISNLTQEKFKSELGGRVFDRVEKRIIFDGKSLRGKNRPVISSYDSRNP